MSSLNILARRRVVSPRKVPFFLSSNMYRLKQLERKDTQKASGYFEFINRILDSRDSRGAQYLRLRLFTPSLEALERINIHNILRDNTLFSALAGLCYNPKSQTIDLRKLVLIERVPEGATIAEAFDLLTQDCQIAA